MIRQRTPDYIFLAEFEDEDLILTLYEDFEEDEYHNLWKKWFVEMEVKNKENFQIDDSCPLLSEHDAQEKAEERFFMLLSAYTDLMVHFVKGQKLNL